MYYVLSAGTNLGDRLANLTYCREALDLVPGTHVVSASAVYQTSRWVMPGRTIFTTCAFW